MIVQDRTQKLAAYTLLKSNLKPVEKDEPKRFKFEVIPKFSGDMKTYIKECEKFLFSR
ncbi:hypothetical protein [Pseudomonas amygdali]|uniref:hypothetical protein n=1 Tax=Pseudomonas amygdali TaxID=47877 RepID=UPI000A8AFF20|nr:hypothetical protein [Pseudomonas amygdali]